MSMQLVFLIVWLALTAAGALLWRSGDRSGRVLVLVNATNSIGAAGMWLTSLGYLWGGSALIALMFGIMGVAIWRMDRTVLRQMAPILWVCGGAMAAVVLTEVSSWLGAPRKVQLTLLALVVVLSAVFIVWGSVSASRRVWAAYRIGRAHRARPQP